MIRSATHRSLLVATALALALLSYFVLVVHEATQRGQVARLESRQAGAAPTGANRLEAPALEPQRDALTRH